MISGKFLVYVEIIYNVNCFQVENILRGFFFRFPENVFCILTGLRQNSFKPNKFFLEESVLLEIILGGREDVNTSYAQKSFSSGKYFTENGNSFDGFVCFDVKQCPM